MKERFSRLFDTGAKKRGLLLLCIVAAAALTCAGLFGCRKGSETELGQHNEYAKEADDARNISDSDIETVIQRALDENFSFKRAIRSSWNTEFGSVAHVTLRVDEDENTAYAYILTMESEYHFEHINSERIFTVCSGTGLIPAKMTLLKSDGKYKYDKIEYPTDGDMWIESLETMDYPDDLLKLTSKEAADKYNSYLSDYNDSRAEEYLKSNNINARVVRYIYHRTADMENPTDMKSIALPYRLLDMYSEYPYFIGGEERVENGVRYLYTKDFDSSTQIITYTKTEFDTGKIIEKAVIDASSGDIKYLSGTPRKEH